MVYFRRVLPIEGSQTSGFAVFGFGVAFLDNRILSAHGTIVDKMSVYVGVVVFGWCGHVANSLLFDINIIP